MKKFTVITDTTSDLVREDRDAYGIDYAKMVFTIDDKDYDADLDWPTLSADEYYTLMRNGKRSITGQVRDEEYRTVFSRHLDAGEDVLYIACSSKLSGSLAASERVSAELAEKYPDRKIVCFDSLRSNYAEGMMAIRAAKLALDGASLEEAVEVLTAERLKYQTYATVGSLNWLKMAGRVKASKAFFGNLFGVKPVIVSDCKGFNYAFEKIKGRQGSLEELAKIIAERLEKPEEATVYIEHANCLEAAKVVEECLKAKVAVKEVKISSVGPIIGATTGPDTVTVSFFGKEVTISEN